MPQTGRLRGRVAGQSAMADVLRAQSSSRGRGRFARLVGASPLTPEARLSYRAAVGELIVGDILENVGPSWDVLHDLPLGASLLDHLVIGPAGVIAVRASYCGDGDVTVDGDILTVAGENRTDVADARTDAIAAAGLLGVAAGTPVLVQPLLAVVSPRRLVTRSQPEGVLVVDSRDLARTLARAPRRLEGADVARLSDLADLAATWAPIQGADLDTQALHREFTLVRAEVRSALARRLMWGVAGFAALCGVVWGLAATVTGIILSA